MVGLTALTVLTGDARLALTLPGADVTLPIGRTQSVAVTPEEKHKTFTPRARGAECGQHSLLKDSMLRMIHRNVKGCSLDSNPDTFCEC